MSEFLFSGLRVIDCATVIAAPAAAMMLADFGADVIKIEDPQSGDMLRILSDIPTTPDAGNDWFWQLDGRNKRSLTLDLKSQAGMAVLHKLIARCDVFITNHPYSVRDSLGLRYEDLQPFNPGMIYASLTAYGEKGPERERKGFDQLAYWARSGLMELMRAPDTTPTQGLPGMGDHPTGVAVYAGIVTALLHRERTGEGSMVHTSLLANGLWSAAGIAQGVMAGGDMPQYREANRLGGAMGRVYQTADGRWLQFNMVRDTELAAKMFIAMEASHLLSDERFAGAEDMWANRGVLGDEIQAILVQRTSDAWLAAFDAVGVPVNRVAVVEETAQDPQILQNRMAVEHGQPDIDTPVLINHPIQITSVPQVAPRRAPELGEHAEEILKELDYSDAQIAELRGQSII